MSKPAWLLVSVLCFFTAPPAVSQTVSESPKEWALSFLQALYLKHDVKSFAQAFSPDFAEHDLDMDQGFGAYLDMASHLKGIWKPLRTVADGDLVAVQSHLESDGKTFVRVDVFQFKGDKFQAHWDVTQIESAATANGHTMEDGAPGLGHPNGQEGEGKKLVRAFFEDFFTQGKDVGDSLIAADYIQHNPGIKDGRDVIKRFAARKIPVKVHLLIAEGDLVLALNEYSAGMAVDLFRVQNHRLQEHWDVNQPLPEDVPDGRSVF